MTTPLISDESRAFSLGVDAARRDYPSRHGSPPVESYDHTGPFGDGYRWQWARELGVSETRKRQNMAPFGSDRPRV